MEVVFIAGIASIIIARILKKRRQPQERLLRARDRLQSRDRLKGQPQERQRSDAAGGTRDRLPPASDSIFARGIVTRRAETRTARLGERSE